MCLIKFATMVSQYRFDGDFLFVKPFFFLSTHISSLLVFIISLDKDLTINPFTDFFFQVNFPKM